MMREAVGIRFFAVPGRHVEFCTRNIPAEEWVEPKLPAGRDAVDKALAGAEFRDMRAKDRLRVVFRQPLPANNSFFGEDFGPVAVFAQPPQDLPALLRMADQLEQLASMEVGERALVWSCRSCGTRYAVPVALAQPVIIRCERCDAPIELFAEYSSGEEALLDPVRGTINVARRELAGFFREAMARGWPVLVCSMTREKRDLHAPAAS